MRINRDKNQDADIYLFNSDKCIIDMIISQFKNVDPMKCPKVVLEEPDVPYSPRSEYDCTKRHSNDYATILIEKIQELDFGEYDKAYLKEQIGCTGKQYFSKVINKVFERLERKGRRSIHRENSNEETIMLFDRMVTRSRYSRKIIIAPIEYHE